MEDFTMPAKKLVVRLRNGFSDRNKIKSENTNMQFKTLDDRSRIALINVTNQLFEDYFNFYSSDKQEIIKNILKDVYLFEIDYSAQYNDTVFDYIKKTIRSDDYDDVLSLIEYISNKLDKIIFFNMKNAQDYYNPVFENEYVGYRIINGIILPITNNDEVAAIEAATKTKYQNINDFLIKASIHISNRNKPDYENSIKESISAVEAMCNIITGRKSTLGASLVKLKSNGVHIHPSLMSGFEKLYGYTSDASGIRHAGQLGDEAATLEEARFMLVACSAFVNYLLGNYEKNVLLEG